MFLLLITVAAVWFIIGCGGFIFWWTKDYDFTSDEVFTCFGAGLTGPFAWFIGWSIHADKIIFKQRR